MGITIAQFIEEVEPIGQLQLKGKEDKKTRIYDVFRPDDLEERFYIKYFEARARSIDVVRKYSKLEMVQGVPVSVPSDNPGDVLRMESELHAPARDMVAALIQIKPENINLRPRTLIKVYNTVEKMLNEAAVPEVDEVEIPGIEEAGEDGGEATPEKKD